MRRIAILTSSRADYGIYLPLLNALKNDKWFELKIVVFGSHLSSLHGYSYDEIIRDGFEPYYKIESLVDGDSPDAISTSMGITLLKFSDFWRNHSNEFDIVLCLGDRFEMFAAVSSGIPFNIIFGHLHGGETTKGAIDNIFRNSITLSSKYHFVSCQQHAERVSELTGTQANIYNTGALSLDNLKYLKLISKNSFLSKYGIDLNKPTILATLHPETIMVEKNSRNAEVFAESLLKLNKYQVIISLPNADSLNSVIRKRMLQLSSEYNDRIFCFDNLGIQDYFSAMKNCSFIIGNSSSGIIEAASFRKWVINVGCRQEGRKQSSNVFNTSFDKKSIIKAVKLIEKEPEYKGDNIYYKENTAKKICSILRNI